MELSAISCISSTNVTLPPVPHLSQVGSLTSGIKLHFKVFCWLQVCDTVHFGIYVHISGRFIQLSVLTHKRHGVFSRDYYLLLREPPISFFSHLFMGYLRTFYQL
jgi:hypothetical protein